MARIEEEFPLIMAMLILCLSQAVSLLSPDTCEILFPISEMKLLDDLPITPVVSTASGSNL